MESYTSPSENQDLYSERSSERFLAAVSPTESPDDERTTAAPPSFESAFAVLDNQAEHLQTLRATLARLHDSSSEQERLLNRLESELSASRAEVEQQRALVGDLRTDLAARDQMLGTVRDAVSQLGRVLDPASPAPTPDNGPF
jgi:septal ring factor EnvC (AmiA/AmiB activator)